MPVARIGQHNVGSGDTIPGGITFMKRVVCALGLVLFTSAMLGEDIAGVHGWIEDGLAKMPGTPSEAVRRSILEGAKYVFVDDLTKNVYVIDDPEAVKGHEGHHVSVAGGMDKVAMTVHISKLTMLKNQKPGPAADALGH
jgi:hypothetical protein